MFIKLGDHVFNASEIEYINFASCGAYVHLKGGETVKLSTVPEHEKEQAIVTLTKRGEK